jgi:hypothetical protein
MTAISRLVPFTVLLALATACAGASHATEQPTPTATSTSTATTKPAAHTAIRRLRPVAKLTAACPLLSAAELKTLLGGTSRTKVTATEGKAPTSTSHECKYGSKSNAPFVLVVDGTKQEDGFTPKVEIDAIVKPHRRDKTKIRNVTGVGEVAVFFTFKDGVSELVASKRSHGQTRMVIFDAPVVVPERKFVDVVKLVLSRV